MQHPLLTSKSTKCGISSISAAAKQVVFGMCTFFDICSWEIHSLSTLSRWQKKSRERSVSVDRQWKVLTLKWAHLVVRYTFLKCRDPSERKKTAQFNGQRLTVHCDILNSHSASLKTTVWVSTAMNRGMGEIVMKESTPHCGTLTLKTKRYVYLYDEGHYIHIHSKLLWQNGQ